MFSYVDVCVNMNYGLRVSSSGGRGVPPKQHTIASSPKSSLSRHTNLPPPPPPHAGSSPNNWGLHVDSTTYGSNNRYVVSHCCCTLICSFHIPIDKQVFVWRWFVTDWTYPLCFPEKTKTVLKMYIHCTCTLYKLGLSNLCIVTFRMTKINHQCLLLVHLQVYAGIKALQVTAAFRSTRIGDSYFPKLCVCVVLRI